MRIEAVDQLWLDSVNEKAEQQLERCFALSEWPLVEGGEDLPGLDIGVELGKNIGGDEGDLAQKTSFAEGAQDGQTVGGADVDAEGQGVAGKQLFGLAIGFGGLSVGLCGR